MGYILGQCPQCNNVMSMPDDSAEVRCPTCGGIVIAAEAAALAGTASQMQRPAGGTAQAPVDMQPQLTEPTAGAAPRQSAPDDPWTAAAASSGPQPGVVQPPAAPGAPAPANAPLRGTWKTNTLFTVLGVLAAGVLNSLLELAGDVSFPAGLVALAYLVFAIVYAARLYPSYFSEKPALDSSEAISFLNTFAGGIIFGLLWNHNLTRGEKGVSHIVYLVLIGCTFLLGILFVVTPG